MALVLSLTLGLGVLLIYLSATSSPRDEATEPTETLSARLEAFLREAGVEDVGLADFILLSLGAGIGAGGMAQLTLGWPLVSVVAFVIGSALPVWYFRQRRERRRAAMQEAMADAVDVLRMAVRSGLSIEEGVVSLARNGPEMLRPVFAELSRELRWSSFDEAVRPVAARLADPVFDIVAAALALSSRLGGRNLGAVLEGLSRSVRQEVQVRREVRAQQAKNVLSARIVAALPLGLVLAIKGVHPHFLEPFSSPAGQAILALCLLSVAVGYAAMLWATRLPEDGRVLRW